MLEAFPGALAAELSPPPQQPAQDPYQPYQPQAQPPPDYLPWVLAGGAALVVVAVLATRR